LGKRRRIDRSIAHNDVGRAREIGGGRRAGPRFPRKLRLGLWEIYLCPKKKYSSEPDIKNGQQLSVELKIIRL
jgi:hypothetical protein